MNPKDISWQLRDDPDRPGHVQLIVDGKLVYTIPKCSLKWPVEES